MGFGYVGAYDKTPAASFKPLSMSTMVDENSALRDRSGLLGLVDAAKEGMGKISSRHAYS
jgi:hypothetical protein